MTIKTKQKAPKGRAAKFDRAREIVRSGYVQRWQGEHLVRNEAGEVYRVVNDTCECVDYRRHQDIPMYTCKHVLAVAIMEFGRRYGEVEIVAAPHLHLVREVAA